MLRPVSVLFVTTAALTTSVLAAEPGSAQALSEVESLRRELEEGLAQQQASMDHIWTMVAAALVFLMQGGFLLLEAGMVRSKNSISVAQKNIADFVVAASAFYLVGFSLMFGPSIGGWIGSGLWAFDQAPDWDYTFFVFQVVFCGTAATIVSGAVAERMNFHGYLLIALVISLAIYPIFGHWAWGNLLIGDNPAWLADQGFIDFAGSTVVHSVGGWVALAAIIVLGPRLGKFEGGRVRTITGHSAVLATLGAVLLWIGWIGFNGGSTTTGTSDFARIVFNTMLAGAFGGTIGMLLGRRVDGVFRPDRSINGVLGALVGITAGCDAVSPHSAVIIGISSALLVTASQEFIERVLKLDDVVGAVSVHGVCGAWGTIMAGALAMPEKLAVETRWEQILVQAEGVAVGLIWIFGVAFLALKVIDKLFPLRVTLEDELKGLNAAEHGTTLGTGLLQEAMKQLADGEADLSRRLDDSTGDEAAELAYLFNSVMGRLQDMVVAVSEGASRLVGASIDLRDVSEALEGGSQSITHRASRVSGATADLDRSVGTMGNTLDSVQQQADGVQTRAGSVSGEINGIVGNVDELARAIEDISRNTEEAARFAADAQDRSRTAGARVDQLKEATSHIQSFLEAIRDISQKSRMLALNAAIEAERAGEAGQGFRVVALEVRQLTAETEKAAEQAERRLTEIDGTTTEVTSVMSEIADIISRVNLAASTISGAVQEQNSMAGQIRDRARQVGDAAKSMTDTASEMAGKAQEALSDAGQAKEATGEVLNNIEAVGEAISVGRDNVSQVQNAAGRISEIASGLDEMIGRLSRPTTAVPAE